MAYFNTKIYLISPYDHFFGTFLLINCLRENMILFKQLKKMQFFTSEKMLFLGPWKNAREKMNLDDNFMFIYTWYFSWRKST